MTKTIAITAIVLVAVVMGFSTIAPALQQAFAHDVTEAKGKIGLGGCPEGFLPTTPAFTGEHPDHNFNDVICVKIAGQHRILVDDNLPPSI